MLEKEDRRHLIAAAMEARRHAYAPYSRYAVGAAVLTASGKIYTGANVENAVYPLGLCAERVALFKAVSEGEREFVAIAVVSANGGTPCGSCRQALREFGARWEIVVADEQGRVVLQTTLADLLPFAFSAKDLGQGA